LRDHLLGNAFAHHGFGDYCVGNGDHPFARGEGGVAGGDFEVGLAGAERLEQVAARRVVAEEGRVESVDHFDRCAVLVERRAAGELVEDPQGHLHVAVHQLVAVMEATLAVDEQGKRVGGLYRWGGNRVCGGQDKASRHEGRQKASRRCFHELVAPVNRM